MRSSTTKRASHKAHQTVTEDFIELSTGSESIRIGFTEQKISGRAGISTFCGFLGWHRFGELLAKVLPQREAKAAGGHGGRPAQPAHEIALGFIAGILSGAQRLTHVGWLRADPMLRRLLGVEQIATQCGLGTAANLRLHFRAEIGVSPTAYRRTFAQEPAA